MVLDRLNCGLRRTTVNVDGNMTEETRKGKLSVSPGHNVSSYIPHYAFKLGAKISLFPP